MQNYHNYDRTIHADAEESLSKIVNMIPNNSIVLDVGCSTGMLGRHLSEKKGCIVDGVDFDSTAIEICRPKYRFTAVRNLESELLTDVFKTEAYDYIIVADVIEHLINPELLLSELKKLIKPHGTVIFSIPNITHIASSLELLLGNFDYRQNGLLDSTHLRFYSYRNLVEKLINAGLYVWETDAVRKNLAETEFGIEQSKLFPRKWLDTLISIRPDSLVYQWIVATKIYPQLSQIVTHPATKKITTKPIFTTALYWENNPRAGFNETNSIVGIITSGIDNELTIDFNFQLSPEQKVYSVRIDPVSENKFVWIKSAKIINNQKMVVWNWISKDQSSDLISAKWIDTRISIGKILSPESDDPQWYPEIPVEVLQKITSGAKCSVVMCDDSGTICSIISDTLMHIRSSVEDLDAQNTVLYQSMAERDGQIANLNQAVAERDGQITNLNQAVVERDGQITNLNQVVAERDGLIANLSGSIGEILGSKSWRVTASLRFLSSSVRKIRSVLFILPQVLQQGGGLWATINKTVNTFRNEGMVGARIKLRWFFARQQENSCVRIQAIDSEVIESIENYRQYEEQHDYSSSIVHADIKVLSYYLPQFHPIPENDLWHGKGFTEWTKVSASAPLFEGHYQQHIPHPDIGYYLLDSPNTLRLQAEQMQKSGVHGQVFYHYWFSGKLILEEPAQLLLNTPDIQMPFCFCWANENWTRRWDGNEKEILLGQNYSVQDAHDFIRYLIPFFKDPRYIKVEDRPMLFIYRASSIPNSQEYLDIWENECAKAGVKRPYVVAVLTRGAINPHEFGMDAGVERVLHDWTDGAVPEIKNALRGYLPIKGSVFLYEEVANFYMKQTEAKDFTYFRSLVPIWDNTARYGSEAYLLHGSSPQRFQEWMESTITYTQSMLAPDRRFVLVNAWNEWAEGAHLEPDIRYGYSYLNSVGRALAGVPYAGELNPVCTIPVGTKLHLSLSESTLNQLQSDPIIKQRFIHCLSQSSVLDICSVSINTSDLIPDLLMQADSNHADFILEFSNVLFFDPTVIEKMLQAALVSATAVVANSYGENSPLVEVTENGSVNALVADTSPLLLIPKSAKKSGYKNVRMRTDAHCFLSCQNSIHNTDKPVVTTIIRFHKSANLSELKNALYCLYAMQNCIVIPLIAAQDLNEHQIDALQNMLSGFTWMQGCEPQVHYYQSQDGKGDLRSKMLNEALKKVKTRYAAFLDFDDLLMPCAYGWLVDRLIKSGKAVSFGCVYESSYDCARELIIERKRNFEYGYSFEGFVSCNHAPLHSFMLDMDRLDLSHITYFEDQRYMEDYLLTLQLFTKDNCDWDSLKENYYLGDYIHSIYRNHTLALSDENERQILLSNPEYMICEQRICEMRKSCLGGG